MPYTWVKCLACNGTGVSSFKSPTDGKWKTMTCTACSGVGKVYVKTK